MLKTFLFNGRRPGFKSFLAVRTCAGHFIFACLSFPFSRFRRAKRYLSPQRQPNYRSGMRREHPSEGEVEAHGSCFAGCLALFLLMFRKERAEKPITYSKELNPACCKPFSSPSPTPLPPPLRTITPNSDLAS